jgi:hypothetical protein
MKIEVVTHCFNYATLLKHQLSSLVIWPPQDVEVTVTVFFSTVDSYTCEVVRFMEKCRVENVTWNWVEQPVEQLCRRSIGRNLASENSAADWVWFCDADYFFTQDCWSAFELLDLAGQRLIFPEYVNAHRRLRLGDLLIAESKGSYGLALPNLDDFHPKRMDRAIGGIQVVSGDVGRKFGYLKDVVDAQAPRPDGIWRRTFEDVWYRQQLGTDGQAVKIDGVYRIRHSRTGRHDPMLVL